MENPEAKRARERRYYHEHCEVLRQRQAEYRQRNRERINARRKEQRQARKMQDAMKVDGVTRTEGLVCTRCRWYLRRDTCTESFFRVVTAGIHIAETCKAYDEQHD